jgi:uncharacterized small protein (DUF1192 family)
MTTKPLTMKTLLNIFLISVFSLAFAMANNTWEETLRKSINTLLPDDGFSLENLDIDSNAKTISGIGTFFEQSGAAFSATFYSATSIKSFEVSFPSHIKIGIDEGKISKVAGEQLGKLLPSALSSGVYLRKLSFGFSEADKTVDNLQMWYDFEGSWSLLPANMLQLSQVEVHFDIDDPSSKDSRNIKGNISGTTRFGSFPVAMTANLSSKNKEDLQFSGRIAKLGFSESIRSLAGKNSLMGLPMPTQMISLNLKDALITVRPKKSWAGIDAKSNWGNVNLWAQKAQEKGKSMDYVVVIAPPKGFKISKINNKLTALDGLDLSKQKIVFSSEKKDKKEASKVPSLSEIPSAIKKGCNLLARLDLTKIKMDHLLGMKELIVNSALTDKLEDVVLESELDADIKLGATNKLKNVLFRLQPSPKDFAISLVGVMDANVGSDELNFTGGVEIAINDQALNFLSMMDGDWNDPLGVTGLKMSNVKMQMGASFITAPTVLPNVALDGILHIGRFQGDAALAFDTRNPAKSMISAKFNELVFWDVVDMLIDDRISKRLPGEMKKFLNSIRMTDVHLEAVPQAMRVLEQSYEAGFRAGGEIEVLGVKGMSKVNLSYSNGMLVQAEVDPIKLGIFKLEGAGKNARPGFIIDLRKGHSPKAAINGLVGLLGLQAETDIEVLPNGFRFKVGGKIFNVFNGEITASGADLQRGGDMYLKVKMENDLLGFIDREVIKFVENSTGSAIQKLTQAQRKLTDAQRAVNRWEKEIKIMRAYVAKDQAKDRAKIEKAQRDVTNAQGKVNSLNKEIKKLKAELKRKNKPYHAPERAYIRTKLAGLYTAKATAWTALEGYKKIVLGLMKKFNTNPDADARVIALKANKNTALGTLEAAKIFMEGLKKTLGFTGDVATFVIDKGTDALINVRSAEFEGRLGALSGGAVKMKMKLEWMGKTKDVSLDFDFDSPAETVKALAKKLMDK